MSLFKDIRWAFLALRIRAYRRTLRPMERKLFDLYLARENDALTVGRQAYPGALYIAEEADFRRAKTEARKQYEAERYW